jgi:DNA-binding transcriptional MerR regulator
MRIGELSRRTEVPVRMLRYYEQQGLLSPERADNGYRSYTEADVERAMLVRSLIRSGMPTKLIVPLLQRPEPGSPPDRTVLDLMQDELDRLNSRISCLTLSRDTVAAYVAGCTQTLRSA